LVRGKEWLTILQKVVKELLTLRSAPNEGYDFSWISSDLSPIAYVEELINGKQKRTIRKYRDRVLMVCKASFNDTFQYSEFL